MLINYIKHKRKEIDYCNICGEKTNLTWDHIPPKGVCYGKDYIANTIVAGLPEENRYMKRYQSGLRYRSICKYCNNEKLGYYDKFYKCFIDNINDEMHKSKNLEAGMIKVPVSINKVCRAMVGHMLAAKDSYESEPIAEQKMRHYFFDENIKMSEIKLYTWLYQYSTIVILRDYVVTSYFNGTHPNGLISHISSYPLAYLISLDTQDCYMDDLSSYTTDNIEDVVDIDIHLNTLYIKNTPKYKHFGWPCDIGENETSDAMMILGNSKLLDDSRLAVIKENNQKAL